MLISNVITRQNMQINKSFLFLQLNSMTHCLLLMLRPFLSVNQKRCIFTHLPSTNMQTVFCIVLLDFFSFKNLGPNTLHTPLNTFPIFGPPTFGFCSQSAREVSKSLKISEEGVSSMLNVIF